jgi:hypothetical protein
MTDSTARRRGHGEDAIYFDAAKNRYVGAISVGFDPDGKRIRRKVTGRTKAEVRDKLKAAHNEIDRGLHTSATYTVRQAVDDWLEGGLPGRSERTRSIYREALKPLLEHIGLKPLRELAQPSAVARSCDTGGAGGARCRRRWPAGAPSASCWTNSRCSPDIVALARARHHGSTASRRPPSDK